MYELKNGRLILHGKTPPIYWVPNSELEVQDPQTGIWEPVPFVVSHGRQFILGYVETFNLAGLSVREKQNA